MGEVHTVQSRGSGSAMIKFKTFYRGPGPGSDEVEMDAGDPHPIAAEANGYVELLVTKSFGDDGDWRGPLYADADYTPSLMATAIHLAEWKVCHNVKTRGLEAEPLKLRRSFVRPWRECALPETWYSVSA
eukprot:jgi/Tetstr1/447819/TSEL_035149.t1